jgi:DNA-binding CsgD family transcriptional regulator
MGNLVAALAAMRRGEISIAIRYAQQMKEDAVFRQEMSFAGQSAWVIVQIADAEEGRGRAATLATRLLLSGSVVRQLLKSEPAAAPWLVRLMLSHGERVLAERAMGAARDLAEANPGLRSIAAASLHATGLFENDAATLAQAAQSHIDPWARASAMEDVGVLLSKRKWERTGAVENLERAMRCYSEIGSIRDFSRVKIRLRRIKAHTHPLDHGRLPSGIPSLTDTEYATAKLVAQGFTNGQVADQLFLSQHTVAFHLRKIFRKLGVSSRVQLARAWNDLDSGASECKSPELAVPAAPYRRRLIEAREH